MSGDVQMILDLAARLRRRGRHPLQVLAVVGRGRHLLVRHRHGVRLVTGVAQGLEAGLGVEISRREDVGGRHQEAGRRIRITDAEVERLVAFENVVEGRERTVPVHDHMRVVADIAVAVDDTGDDLAAGAIDRLDPRFVSVPGDLDLVEAHRFDDAGIVGCVEPVDLETGRFGHCLQERFPILLLVDRGLGRDHAEIDLRGRLRAGRRGRYPDCQGSGRTGEKSSHHGSSPGDGMFRRDGEPKAFAQALRRSWSAGPCPAAAGWPETAVSPFGTRNATSSRSRGRHGCSNPGEKNSPLSAP